MSVVGGLAQHEGVWSRKGAWPAPAPQYRPGAASHAQRAHQRAAHHERVRLPTARYCLQSYIHSFVYSFTIDTSNVLKTSSVALEKTLRDITSPCRTSAQLNLSHRLVLDLDYYCGGLIQTSHHLNVVDMTSLQLFQNNTSFNGVEGFLVVH